MKNNSGTGHLHITYFGTTRTMTKDMLPPKMKEERMFAMFSSNLVESMKNVAELQSLKTVDMIFFPIKQQNHFYVIVFNMKTPSLVILDNRASNMNIDDKYGELLVMLQFALVNYLKSVKHPRVNSISKLKPQRYRLKWRTIDNNNNSGIFTMRHMETFKGETVSKYDCEILKEIEPQEGQLNKLHKKYLAKILLGNNNALRYKVISQATDFQNEDGK